MFEKLRNLITNKDSKGSIVSFICIFIFLILPWIISYWIPFFIVVGFFLNLIFTAFYSDKVKKDIESSNRKSKKLLFVVKIIDAISKYFLLLTEGFINAVGGIIGLLVVIAILGGLIGILYFGWKQLIG